MFEQYNLLVHVLGREFGVIANFQRRCSASGVVAAEHASINQENFAAKSWPNSPAFLNCVPYRDMRGLRPPRAYSPAPRPLLRSTGHNHETTADHQAAR